MVLHLPIEFLDAYLNGPRILSDERLAYLIISTSAPTFSSTSPDEEQEYDLFLLSTHFLGDSMALHTTANEFFELLAADGPKGIEAVLAKRSSEDIEYGEEEEIDTARLTEAMEEGLVTLAGWGQMVHGSSSRGTRRSSS